MNVDVVDCLAPVFSRVDDRAVSLRKPLCAGDLGRGPLQVSEEMLVVFLGVSNGRDVLPGDDEDVDGGLRLDVREGVAMLILVDGFGGNASVDDLAENAAHAEKSTGVQDSVVRNRGRLRV